MKIKFAASLLGAALFLPIMTWHMPQSYAQAAIDLKALPPEFAPVLGEKRKLAELTPDELKARFKLLQNAAALPNLPPALHDQIIAMADATKKEFDARAQTPQQKSASAAEAKAAADAKAASDANAKIAGDARAVADTKAVNDTKAKMAADAQAALDAKVTAEAKAAGDAKAVADAKGTADAKAASDAKVKLAAEAQAAADANAAGDAKAKAAALAAATAAQQSAAATQNSAPTVPAKPIETPTTAAPAQAPAVAQAPQPAKGQQPIANAGDPAAEKQAQAYIGSNGDVTKLSDDELRKRLDGIRELLAANQLSQDAERAVRTKLLQEREVLRQRIAIADAAKQQQAAVQTPPPPLAAASGQPLPPPPPAAPPAVANNSGLNFSLSIGIITAATPPRRVLEDIRPAEQLRISELQRRLQVYDDAQADDSYDQAYRDYWRQSLDYDREVLRRRLLDERRQREANLAMQAQQDQLDVEITANFDHPRRSVFAAEVDQRQLQEVLTAAPSQKYRPIYKVENIANDPDLRAALPRIEVDTVHFGYNEGFVREEELAHLDNIASLIERIVKKYPKEVFLIEGHTDAAGSDEYNLNLSQLRAESVKKMMTTYYVIPAENLRTVGLGKRFLKIPTPDPEPENRRVSVARITPLLAQGQ